MEETATSSSENIRYNTEMNLLDGLYEFHHNFFTDLAPQEQAALKEYYLVGSEMPDNVFRYRNDLMRRNPEVAQQAQAAFDKLCKLAGIKPTKKLV